MEMFRNRAHGGPFGILGIRKIPKKPPPFELPLSDLEENDLENFAHTDVSHEIFSSTLFRPRSM